MHYFTFENNHSCLLRALHCGMTYEPDSFGKTPLTYGVQRQSSQCVSILLDHAVTHSGIYSSLT